MNCESAGRDSPTAGPTVPGEPVFPRRQLPPPSPAPVLRALAVSLALAAVSSCASLPSAGPVEDSAAAAVDGPTARRLLVTLDQKPSWRIPRAGTTARGYDRDYRTSVRTRRTVRELAATYGLREVSSWPIAVLGVHCVVFEVPAGRSTAEMVARLRADRRVESAQSMQLFATRAQDAGDPYLNLQYGMESTQVNEAHRWAQGVGVKVAMIDTGVDLRHPDLSGHVGPARDFVDGSSPEDWTDRHGTAVAGIIASAAGNGLGIAGVAPRVELMALRACWPETPGSAAARCNSFTLAKALAFAIDRRAQVVNLSLAGPPDPLLERLVAAALERGAIVVAARGEGPEQAFPCDVPGVLAVRSPGPLRDGEAAGTSDLAAPGVDVLTTVPGGAFDFVSGSSVAAAHVAGITALLLEKRPGLSPARVAELLAATSWTVAQPGGETAVLVNACAALASLVPGVDCAPPPAGAGAGGAL